MRRPSAWKKAGAEARGVHGRQSTSHRRRRAAQARRPQLARLGQHGHARSWPRSIEALRADRDGRIRLWQEHHRERLAEWLRLDNEDGVKLHPTSNVAKMSAGQPLTDKNRWPWLMAIADEIDRVCLAGQHAVIACSALKRAYRDVLVHGRSDVRIIFLDGTQALIGHRPHPAERPFHAAGAVGERIRDAGITRRERKFRHRLDRRLRRRDRRRYRSPAETVPLTAAWLAGTAHDPHRLVVSDVDGTLLTNDKTLIDGARSAVRRSRFRYRLHPSPGSRPDHRPALPDPPLAIGCRSAPSTEADRRSATEIRSSGWSAVAVKHRLGVPERIRHRYCRLFTNGKGSTHNRRRQLHPHEQRAIRAYPTIVGIFQQY